MERRAGGRARAARRVSCPFPGGRAVSGSLQGARSNVWISEVDHGRVGPGAAGRGPWRTFSSGAGSLHYSGSVYPYVPRFLNDPFPRSANTNWAKRSQLVYHSLLWIAGAYRCRLPNRSGYRESWDLGLRGGSIDILLKSA